jgi:hypothetical protein
MTNTQQKQSDGPSPEAVTEKPVNIFAGTCGAQFGVTEPIYDALREFAREVWFLAEVQAVSLKRNCTLKINEGNGVTCTLHGADDRVYRIGVTVISWEGYHDVLGGEGQRDYLACLRFRFENDSWGGYANDYSDWRFFVLRVLRLEGFDNVTHGEVVQWHRDHGTMSKLFGSKMELPEEYFRFLPPGTGSELVRPLPVKEPPKRPKSKKTGL